MVLVDFRLRCRHVLVMEREGLVICLESVQLIDKMFLCQYFLFFETLVGCVHKLPLHLVLPSILVALTVVGAQEGVDLIGIVQGNLHHLFFDMPFGLYPTRLKASAFRGTMARDHLELSLYELFNLLVRSRSNLRGGRVLLAFFMLIGSFSQVVRQPSLLKSGPRLGL